MAAHAIAEIDAPGQACRRAVGHVVEARKETSDAADRDRRGERRDEAQARGTADAGRGFEDLDRDDGAGERALDAAGDPCDAGIGSQQKIASAATSAKASKSVWSSIVPSRPVR
jgi:hypothetical protein